MSLSPLMCLAQPDADFDDNARRQQREHEQQLRQQQESAPDVRLKPSATPDAMARLPRNEIPCFPIKQLLLIGESADHFQWALRAANPPGDEAIPSCLGQAGVKRVIKRVQNAIIKRGYVTTRVLLGPQDLTQEILTLTLQPGRVKSIRFTSETKHPPALLNALPALPGDLLNLRAIEQGLENLKRVPSVDANIEITPSTDAGAGPGDSDLLVSWQQGKSLRLTLSVDDAGSRGTGKYQGSATLSIDNGLRLNDLFYFSVNRDLGGGLPGDRGVRGTTLHYSLSLSWWHLAYTASESAYYQTVPGRHRNFIYSGTSQNSEFKLSRLLYRDAVRKSHVALATWTNASRNYIQKTEIRVQRRRTAGWTLGLNHQEFIGRAVLDCGLSYRHGTGIHNALAAPEQRFGEGSARMQILQANTQLSVPFPLGGQSLRYRFDWRAQWDRTPLTSQDRFSIGGRHSVRGFDGENTLSANRGWRVRNELSLGLGASGSELYLGLDYGEIGGFPSRQLLGKRLAGAAVGLRGNLAQLNFDLFAAQPLSRPDGFRTAPWVSGINLVWSY